MELRSISIEIIKPVSPIPHHLKSHKLSLIDQLHLDNCYGFLLFYSKVDRSIINNISDLLKKSLSKTLIHYYPFSGQVEDDDYIDCDDSGVPFVEARVAINISEVLRKPEMNILERLLPYNPNKKVSSTTKVNFAVQLNYFDCGGVAVCVSLRNVIADGSALANFLKNWAAIARGFNDHKIEYRVIFDCTSIFPPNELVRNILRSTIEKQSSINCITKRFTFDGSKIAALKEKIKNRSKLCATRFELVSALIWGALISMARESGDAASPAIVIPLDVRKLMIPPFPQQSIGNVIYWVTGNWLDNEAIDYSRLAEKIQQLVKMVNDEDVRKYYNSDGLPNQLRKESEEFVGDLRKVNVFSISNWCGLPFYEADFGWGKPTWASKYLKANNVASLADTSDGKGVEAWVGLSEKNMSKFEQDPGILTYASFDPNPIVISQSKL